jgi:TolB-like protein
MMHHAQIFSSVHSRRAPYLRVYVAMGFAALAFFLLAAFTNLSAATPPVAVMPFESAEANLGEAIAARVATALQSRGQFTLIERGQLRRALDEIAVSQSGLVRDEDRIDAGRQVGAQFMVVGEAQREAAGRINASLRIVKIETGVLIAAASASGADATVHAELARVAIEKLSIYLLMDNPESPYSILLKLDRGVNATYKTGDTLTLTFRVEKLKPDAPSTVYIQLYSIDAAGAMTMIYPNKFSPQLQIQTGREYQLPRPEDDFEWTLVPPVGAESIQAIVTSQPVDFFQMRERYASELFPEVQNGRDDRRTFSAIRTRIRRERLRDWSAERITYRVEPGPEEPDSGN